MVSGKELMLKVVLVGDTGVGKTSITHRFVHGVFIEGYKGADFTRISNRELDVGGRCVSLSIFEIGGQEKFRFGENILYKGSDGVILVFDITSEESFESLGDWFGQIRSSLDKEVPLILVGNKYDLAVFRRVPREKAVDYARSIGVDYLESSAKTGKNVIMAFYKLAEKILSTPKYST
ncbi:MAG: Rab family GTPase [Candidatus Jordarchaeaceae archaeon]